MSDKPPKLVMHIGSHKTGTTAIQDYCYKYATELQNGKIYYPRDAFEFFPRQHSHLATLLRRDELKQISAFFSESVKAASDLGCETVFLSGEDLCWIPAGRIIALRKIVETHFDSWTFALLVRNKRDHIMSSYKHFLRYVGAIDENTFLKRFAYSPKDAIANWKAYFSVDGTVVLYDLIKTDFIEKFFSIVLSYNYNGAKVRSNESADFLTANIFNIFLKEHESEGLAKVFWEVSSRHPTFKFMIENLVGDTLSEAVPDSGWIFPEALNAQAKLLSKTLVAESSDPVAVCDKMIDLFTSLRKHFADKSAGAAEAAKGEGGARTATG